MGVEVMARGQRCRSCDETLFDVQEVERQDLVVGAALLDVRPETVSRWERGEVEIPRAVAYAIGEYCEHPRITRQKLEALAQ